MEARLLLHTHTLESTVPLEESILLAQFGEQYVGYQSRVPMLGPGSSCWLEPAIVTLFGAHIGAPPNGGGEATGLLGGGRGADGGEASGQLYS